MHWQLAILSRDGIRGLALGLILDQVLPMPETYILSCHSQLVLCLLNSTVILMISCRHGASDASIQSTWQRLAGLRNTSINPMLLTNEMLLGGQRLNKSRLMQESHIPLSDISHMNSEVQDTSKFFEDSKTETSVDTVKPPSEVASPRS